MLILKQLRSLFKSGKTTYSHRKRTIEIIAAEKGIDINTIYEETVTILKNEGRVEAISKLTKRFHAPLSVAWRFVNKLDVK